MRFGSRMRMLRASRSPFIASFTRSFIPIRIMRLIIETRSPEISSSSMLSSPRILLTIACAVLRFPRKILRCIRAKATNRRFPRRELRCVRRAESRLQNSNSKRKNRFPINFRQTRPFDEFGGGVLPARAKFAGDLLRAAFLFKKFALCFRRAPFGFRRAIRIGDNRVDNRGNAIKSC
jgi:hypothetical protein